MKEKVKMEETKECRICFEKESKEFKLISPCQCRGTQKYIHESCLNQCRMIKTEAYLQCQTCHFKYIIEGPWYEIYLANQAIQFLVATVFLGIFLTIVSKIKLKTETSSTALTRYFYLMAVFLTFYHYIVQDTEPHSIYLLDSVLGALFGFFEFCIIYYKYFMKTCTQLLTFKHTIRNID